MRRRLPIGPGQARLSIATGAAALAALSVLTGCGSSSNGASNSTTLTFFGADYGTGPANSTSKYWNAIAAAFHKANPSITVNVQTVDWTDFPNKVQTLVQNKQFPDILEGDAAPQFAQSHLLYPDGQVLGASVMANLIPTFLKDGQYQGTDYGIPFTTSTRALYYNKKIFTAAGIAAPPETWAELQSDAAKIKAQGLHRLRHAARQRGGAGRVAAVVPGQRRRLPEQRGKYDIDAPQNVATLKFMAGMVKAGDTQPSPGTTDRKDVWAQFAAGRIGMVLGSPAVIPIIQAAGVLQAADYATADVPGKTGPLSPRSGVHDDIVAFNTGGTQRPRSRSSWTSPTRTSTSCSSTTSTTCCRRRPARRARSWPATRCSRAFLKNIPESVNYPRWPTGPTVQDQIQTTIGQAVTGNPQTILGRDPADRPMSSS